ncbi:MAG: hypothetical protein WB239_10985 [Acidimicrobiia bacterium]
MIGTRDGLFDLEHRCLLDSVQVSHIGRGPDGWWAVDSGGRVWHEANLIASSDATLHCIQPTSDGVWLGADQARLLHLAGDRITEDEFFAQAPTRQRWHTPWGGPPDVRSLAYGPDGVLYVNVHVGGILRYDDSGISPILDIDADAHQVVADPDRGGVVLAATARGLAQSGDGHDFGFRREGLAHQYCRAVAVGGRTVLLSVSRGPRGGDSQVYRSALSGGPFEPCRNGLPDDFQTNVDTHHLLAREDNFFLGHGTTLWRSDDEGRSWEVAATELPPITCLA